MLERWIRSPGAASGRWSPLELSPDGRVDRDAFLAEIRARRDVVQSLLLEHGAIRFRGFLPGTAEDLDAFTEAAGLVLMDYRRGVANRSKVRGRIYTSTELPSGVPIPPHLEMSYTSVYPIQIAFLCETAPAERGETPLTDAAQVLEEIPEAVLRRFLDHGVVYFQSVPARSGRWRKHRWQSMFETDDRGEVEAICREQSIEPTWRPDGGIELRNRRPATLRHPKTGRETWFNHAHVFHPSFSSELRREGQLARWAIVRTAESLLSRRTVARLLRHDVEYGDGTPIPRHDIEAVRDALWRHVVVEPWRKGDLVLLDNLRIAHARMPFRGPRRVLAALAESVEAA